MTDTPKVVPAEIKEFDAPAQVEKPAVVGPPAPAEIKPAEELETPKI